MSVVSGSEELEEHLFEVSSGKGGRRRVKAGCGEAPVGP